MLRDVFRKSLWEQRRAIAWWIAGVAAFVGITIAFYPSIHSSAADFEDFLQQLPEGFRTLFVGNESDITSPIGYLDSQVFASNGAILLLVFAIGAGGRAIAGEEERGTLDLLLSAPVSRRTVVLQKFAALALGLAALSAALYVFLVAAGRPVGIDVSIVDLLAAVVHQYLFALAFGAVTLAVGCATGRKGLALGIASALAVAAFLLNSLAPIADATRFLQKVSPFYYANGATPLRTGFDPVGLVVLFALTVAATILAAATFERRDLAA